MEKKKFKFYNQLTEEFDVVTMTRQELTKVKSNEQYLVLLPKTKDPNGPKPPKHPKKPTVRDLLVEFMARQEKFNNFVLEQFKNHGWIK